MSHHGTEIPRATSLFLVFNPTAVREIAIICDKMTPAPPAPGAVLALGTFLWDLASDIGTWHPVMHTDQ
jgi:hypothetical protein